MCARAPHHFIRAVSRQVSKVSTKIKWSTFKQMNCSPKRLSERFQAHKRILFKQFSFLLRAHIVIVRSFALKPFLQFWHFCLQWRETIEGMNMSLSLLFGGWIYVVFIIVCCFNDTTRIVRSLSYYGYGNYAIIQMDFLFSFVENGTTDNRPKLSSLNRLCAKLILSILFR